MPLACRLNPEKLAQLQPAFWPTFALKLRFISLNPQPTPQRLWRAAPDEGNVEVEVKVGPPAAREEEPVFRTVSYFSHCPMMACFLTFESYRSGRNAVLYGVSAQARISSSPRAGERLKRIRFEFEMARHTQPGPAQRPGPSPKREEEAMRGLRNTSQFSDRP